MFTLLLFQAHELARNVYMYDDEDTSSLVYSKILNLSIKNQTGDIEIKKMTYTQKVAPANLVVIDPSIYANRDDASGFTYH